MEFILFIFDNNEDKKVYIDDLTFSEVRDLIGEELDGGCSGVFYGITRSEDYEDVILREINLETYLLSPGLRDMIIP